MSAANLLFVAGCGRSGTSALANYLNEHERILICIERYKYVPEEIDPTFFTFERILDYSERETNLSRERYTKLLEEKDPAKLKWIGDKTPGYHRYFGTLLENNPGARFLVTYRPVEEVAESFEARARNPQDRWPGEKNFEQGVGSWNRALRDTREFVESELKPKVLIVDYHDFFYRNELCVPLISRFLGLEFDKTVRGAWEARSRRYEDRRRRKEPLTEEQAKFVRANKDYAVEGWVLDRIDKQWEELGLRAEKNIPGAPQDKRHGLVVDHVAVEERSQTLRLQQLLEQQLQAGQQVVEEP